MKENLYVQQIATGFLRAHVTDPGNLPVPNATVTISYKNEPDHIPHQLTTDSSGQTEMIRLPAPPAEYSLDPANLEQPYSSYNIRIEAAGFKPMEIFGSEVLAATTSLQPVVLKPLTDPAAISPVVIPDHILYGDYPPKIAEAESKTAGENSEIVLSRVAVPQTIIVHDGAPTDSSAKNYHVPYCDYIKNVASSEIYPTWPEAAITANILVIMSFTLNRIYTDWYRNQGYDFTITSSTAFDHKWIPGRNIYKNIALIVDHIFDNYLSRPDVKQPILTQYCTGRKVCCPDWLTQWGSFELAGQGYSAIEIIRHFYGADMYINTAEQIAGIPSSWPGENLTIDSSGEKIRRLQEQLNAIAAAYNAIPSVAADGIYGANTAAAVSAFQSVFDLPVTGIADCAAWHKISHIYIAITRIAKLD